jgi:repressor LexA
MTPRICDGDVVIVRKQEAADPGDIVIATINGDDAVCKKLQIFGKAVLLYSLNPSYEPIDVTGREDFKIIGKVIELRGKF